VTAPTRVDQYPYQDGLLVWYATTLYDDNNTSSHPGGGRALVVDANPAYQLWWAEDGSPWDYGDGRLNAYDSTFDVDRTDGLHLTKETDGFGDVHYDVDGGPGVPVFEDSDPDAYWDDFGGQLGPVPGWFSTKVAGVGTELQVVSSDERSGRMEVKAGARFVADTSPASIDGSAAVGRTLVAVTPTWFQEDVTATYQWLVDGRPVSGASASTYVVPKSILGRRISVAVVGAKAGYASTRVVSESVKVRNKPHDH
jgi:immune inhibitor A